MTYLRIAATAGAIALALATATPAAARTTPVRFGVENVNRSLLPCSSDGKRYDLQGWLVAPPSGPGRTVTVYLHEFSFGSHFWRFPDERYDFAEAMAREGATSVVIDRLGYGAGPIPEGNATCLGAQADMASQIVTQLRRSGFTKVALAGHSVGAAIAELAYHSFGGVDDLALFGWAHDGFTPKALQESFIQGGVCARGGEEKRAGAASGYAYYGQQPEDVRPLAFYDAEPAIVELETKLRERDPCGDAASLTASVVLTGRHADEVKVPVLLVMGQNDAVYEPGTAQKQAAAYPNSPDVKLFEQPRAAHALTLEKTAPAMRAAVAKWLHAHGLAEAARPAERADAPPRAKPRKRTAKRKAKKVRKRCRRAARVRSRGAGSRKCPRRSR